jgi:retron-type reverse transcriptase
MNPIYFTLAITATDYSGISKSKKEKVLGSKPGRSTFKAFGGILVGQLARDDRYDATFINGAELLIECERYIERGRQFLGGCIVYLDCKQALVETYQKSHYKLLANEPTEEGYFKMYKVLPDRYA